MPDYRLEFVGFDAGKRTDHTQHIGLLLVLSNRLVRGIVMFLVAQENVVQQGTLTRQETTSYF